VGNNPGCQTPWVINFTNTTSGATSYSWTFGDGGSSTATSPNHSYTSFGTYTVTLTATSSAGCASTKVDSAAVQIEPATATIVANPVGGCLPFTTNFSATSIYNLATTNWTFGDGGSSNAATPTHTYTANGTYLVTLNFVTTDGCTGTDTALVLVSPPTPPSFTTLDSACTNVSVPFTNTTNTAAPGYYLSFGDGS